MGFAKALAGHVLDGIAIAWCWFDRIVMFLINIQWLLLILKMSPFKLKVAQLSFLDLVGGAWLWNMGGPVNKAAASYRYTC